MRMSHTGGLALRTASPEVRDLRNDVAGGLLGALIGGAFVVVVTLALKASMDFLALQSTWILIVVPLVGLTLAALALHGLGRREGSEHASPFRTFPANAIRSDITSDIVNTAGREERFPWRLAPIRLLAILATVGSGAGMGTEAPAAYLGVAAGTCAADRGRRWRQLLRPAGLAGGAAGVGALMGIPLVGTAFMLEMGRRNDAPYSLGRVIAALIGGFVGWAIDVTFGLQLINLVVPKEPPVSGMQAIITVVFIGALAGGITSLTAAALYRAKNWSASPGTRLVIGGLASAIAAIAITRIAEPTAAFGPGGGAIVWAETRAALPLTLLVVALLRAAITTAAAAAGGCGGVFVPFLAIGDLAGRVFAPMLGVGNDLGGAAGAAAGIAGGYRLPLTAVAMVLGVGGPRAATVTCLAVVLMACLVDKLIPLKR
jgi:chloride channel protein, CIC family